MVFARLPLDVQVCCETAQRDAHATSPPSTVRVPWPHCFVFRRMR